MAASMQLLKGARFLSRKTEMLGEEPPGEIKAETLGRWSSPTPRRPVELPIIQLHGLEHHRGLRLLA